MKVLVNLKSHFMFTAVSAVKELTKPLQSLDITFFSFIRTFPDGSHIRLCNHASWTTHYYERQFYPIMLQQIPTFNGHLLWLQLDRYPLFEEASELFNIDNGIVLVESNQSFTDRYFFGSTRASFNLNRFYTFNVDLLYRYTFYFQNQGYNLISQSLVHKIFIPDTHHIDRNIKHSNISAASITQFKEKTQAKRFFLTIDGKEIGFSKREIQILTYIKARLTSKEMAKRLEVTPHTIDCYRENIRKKLGKTGADFNQALQSHRLNKTIW